MMFRNLPKILLAFSAVFVLLIQACTESQKQEIPKVAQDPLLVKAEAWADSILPTLSQQQKAAQLILAQIPATTDSLVADSLGKIWSNAQFGGLVYNSGSRDTMKQFIESWKEGFAILPFIGLDANLNWSKEQDLPSLLALGTAASDSIANAWGEALAAECHFLGAQFCMISGAKVGKNGAWMRDALGTNPELVSNMSIALASGLKSQLVQVCFRPLYDQNDFPSELSTQGLEMPGSLDSLLLSKGLPLRNILEIDPGIWLQLSRTNVPSIDSKPISASEIANNVFLKQAGKHQGLIVTPKSSKWENGLEEMVAGADVWYLDHENANFALEKLQATLSEDLLEQKTRKVLVWKAMLGFNKHSNANLIAADPLPRLRQLNRTISKRTMVILRDSKNRLPIGASFSSQRFATLALGSTKKTELQIIMSNYGEVDHYLHSKSMDSTSLSQQIARLKRYDYVIVGLHEALVKDSVNGHLPNSVIDFLKELDRNKKLIVVDFAGQGSLHGLDSLSCLAFLPDDGDLQANLAGQAILGALPVTAKLPDDISAAFPAGTGKVMNKRLRFEFTSSEDLGIDAKAMWRIDSLINYAISIGVFPGCQVLAAKDGQVFLNRAYGYHDYNRSRRVRNSDLYDIASVSKIAATTLMAMAAYDRDTLRLNQPLKYFMRDLDSNFITIKDITPSQLLIHQAGLPSGIGLTPYYKMMHKPDSVKRVMYSSKRDSSHTVRIAEGIYLNPSYRDSLWDRVCQVGCGPTGTYKYSDLSMYIMKELLERIMSTRIEKYVDSAFYRPMGLRRIGYTPLGKFEREEIVPTEDDRYWRRQVLQGDVHDPTVAFLGGIGGPAGIFSNSQDLATVMQMLLNGGNYGGKQFFDPKTVQLFTGRQANSRRALGFDMQLPNPTKDHGYCCVSAAPETYGHFGFTGTCAWADPKNQIVYVFLSNRVYPSASNSKINVYHIRQAVQQLIYDALGLGLVPDRGMIAVENSDANAQD